MPIVTPTIIAALVAVTQHLPVRTNLGLLQFLWMLVSGSLLNSRGACFPGLLSVGLGSQAIRHAWAAFRYGRWRIAELLAAWRA